MIPDERIHGFTVKRIRPISELNAQFIEMTHDKTGLELAWIKRDEENKTFGISFKTLPWDDTGVFHILEHSVLCGSEKYRVKEPFVELLKASMNTFLNAMTFPDKTVYPISSRNDKDFINLMRVYLDAVFFPLIYEKPEIFYQEGWHYELGDNGAIGYKGVVFNEMKGALAGADEISTVALNRAMFPDSPYRYVSGGDPASIPDLSYEEFVNTHKKFYSPSNGFIFLDGAVDIDKTLEIINAEYLSRFEKGEKIAAPVMQSCVDGGVTEVEFELSEDEQADGKTRISWGRMIGRFDEREKIIAMQILSDVLCGSNQALLSKTVLAQKLAEDVSMMVYDGIAQPWLIIEARNIKDENKTAAEEFIFSELKTLCENGIDRSQLEASMANLEFKMRERDYGRTPQGIYFGINMLETQLYGGDPIVNLQVGDLFDKLRQNMENGYFERLLREVVIENEHRAKVILVPSFDAGENRRKKESDRIADETSVWDEKTREAAMEKQKELLEWQNSEDSEQQLAAMPQIELSDISHEVEDLPTEVSQTDGIVTLYHDVNCSGITNFSLFFDAEDLSEREISALSFLTDILGKMKTKKYDEQELDKNIRNIFGSLDFSVSTYASKKDTAECKIKLCVSFGNLEKNAESALELACEILTETRLDDEAAARDLLRQLKTQYYEKIVMAGSTVGNARVLAQSVAAGVSVEYSGGFEYYKWLCENDNNWDWQQLKSKLQELIKRIVCKNRLTMSLTGGSKALLGKAAQFIGAVLSENGTRQTIDSVIKPWGKRKEGIVIPADISFACAGSYLPGFDGYNASMAIAAKIISLAYLWNVIRVQGGAYGTGFRIRTDGAALSYSYRDPNACGSLESYKGMADFIKDFCSKTDDISGFIIGAVSDCMPLLTAKMRGMKADENYWTAVSDDDRKKELEQMLGSTPQSVAAIAESIKAAYENCGVCVVAGRNQLEECDIDFVETL